MSTDSEAQDGPREPASAADSDASDSPEASLEQLYEEATARLAAITEEWQQALAAVLRD
jgi:hypothetical protein